MKKFVCVVSLLSISLFCVSVCLADSDIPNLVGTWIVKGEGGVALKGKEVGPKTHHKEPFSTLNAEAVLTKQQGRIIHGVFNAPMGGSEKFLGGIGLDNKTIYFVDEDGFIEGKIIDKDKIEVIYRHVSAYDIVVAVGVWTRKK